MTRLLPISCLISPPEAKPYDTFSPKLDPDEEKYHVQPHNRCLEGRRFPPMSRSRSPTASTMRTLPSPPVSPEVQKRDRRDSMDERLEDSNGGGNIRDPVLYPTRSPRTDIPPDQPLFPPNPEPPLSLAEELVTQHMSMPMKMHMADFNKKVDRPSREEYLLAIAFVSTVGRNYNRNPGAYMKRTREETEDQYWRSKRICADPGSKTPKIRSLVNIAPAAPVRQQKKVIKPITSSVTSAPRQKRTPKTSPKQKLLSEPGDGRSATPEPRAPGTKRPEDTDYKSLPDYSPSTSTLPKNNPKSLKADWPSNNLLNLSNDPDRDLLHEAELNLASTLRLSCATYLCSKRRIFEARLNALRINKEFRKTDAQQACKIDVNKASKLWTAYDKVGWFDVSHFRQHL